MKKTINVHTRVEYKFVSDALKKGHRELLEKHGTATVQRIAGLNFSSLNKGASIKEYTEGVRNDYQELVDFVDQHVQGDAVVREQKRDELDTAEKAAALENKIQDKTQSLKLLKARLDEGAKKHQSPILLWKRLRIVLVVLSFLELLFNWQIFFSLGGNLISSLATGVLIALGVYWYSHFTPDLVRKYGRGNTARELGLFILFLLLIGILFYVLATLRLNYLVAMNPELSQGYNLSPWVFTAINLFVYVISYWLVKKFKPSKEDLNRYADYQKAFGEIQNIEKEILRLKDELSALEPALRERTGQRQTVLLLGKQLEDEIQTSYEQCLAEIKLELLLRTNGEVNRLFTKDSIAPLKFNYQSLNRPS